MATIKVNFRVHSKDDSNLKMYLVGGLPELGEWKSQYAILMEKDLEPVVTDTETE